MDKKYKSGLILGKFFSYHMGHSFLIKSALEKCEKLTVLVCSLESEPILGELRYLWVKDSFPTVNVIHVTKNAPLRLNDLNPSFRSSGDDFFWETWVDIIRENIEFVDVVFTSEEYGKELVQKLNQAYPTFQVNNEVVDMARTTYPISGTAIRKDPFSNWGFIPKIVRPYFTKKIALIGPESTGKTTLTKLLANYYKTSYVLEYGREYTDNKDMRLGTNDFTLEDISSIASGHLYREEIYLQDANKLFFSDTETITTEIWSEIYFNKTPNWLRDFNKYCNKRYDMYFLLDVDVPWVDDGTRHLSSPEQRKAHFNRLRDELIKRNLPFAIVNGGYEERFEKIKYGINNFIHFG